MATIEQKFQILHTNIPAAGYNQTNLHIHFDAPTGWLKKYIAKQKTKRDDFLNIFHKADPETSAPQTCSYVSPKLAVIDFNIQTFVQQPSYQTTVAATPGSEFGSNSTNSIRLNFSQDHVAVVTAAKRMVTMVNHYSA